MKMLKLNHGHSALVDDDDFAALGPYKWHAVQDPRGRRVYARRGVWVDGRQRKMLLHNYLMRPTSDQRVVFEDGDSLNCTRANMRLVACAPRRSAGRQVPKLGAEPQTDPLDEEYET
jgi:hypothetical protein